MNQYLKQLKTAYESGNTINKLIYWNIAIAVVTFILSAFFKDVYFDFINIFSLNSQFSVAVTKIWSFFTYSFIHAGLIHLIFNMIMLFYLGQLFTTFFTQIQLLGVYIVGAVFSGLFYVAIAAFFPLGGNVVGASGAIMALLFAVTAYAPYMNVRLMLIGNVKIWHIAVVFIFLDVVQIPFGNAGGHITHLGGALFGALYILLLRKGIDLSSFIIFFQKLFKRQKNQKKHFKNVYKNTTATNNSVSNNKDQVQKRIDEILDKIKKSGYESLSKEEKTFLFQQKE